MSDRIGDEALISRAEGVVAAEVDDEVVILNIDSGYFYQLNKVGARIWNCLETPATVASLSARMQAVFDVAPDTCRSDILEFVRGLRDGGIVTIKVAD